jgi:hypothetical protein
MTPHSLKILKVLHMIGMLFIIVVPVVSIHRSCRLPTLQEITCLSESVDVG